MRSIVLLPLLLLLLLLAPLACAASVSLYGSSVNLTYTSDGTYLYVTVSHDYAAWIAIGWHAASDRFGDPTQMYNADFVIAQFDQSGALLSVSDYVTDPTSSDGEADPLPDTDPTVAAKNCTNDVLAYAGFQSPAGTTFSFKRLLVTNDRYCDRPITNASQLVVWARGDAPGRNGLDYHGGASSTHGALQLNLLSDVVPPPPPAGSDLAPLHGAMMFSAFGILMVFGVFVGRYLKRYWWWFPLHIAVQSSAIVVAVAAFAIALKMVGGAHFSTWHAKIGFTALCLTAVAPVLGVIADRMYDPKRSALPWWPDYTHWISGRLAMGFGWAAIILGILLIGMPKSVAVAAGLLFALYVVLYFSTDFMKRVGGNDYTPAGSDPINTPVGHD